MGTVELDFENRRPQAQHRDGSVKYRLDVASSPADVVGSVGGWLYDRVRAGWDVNVLLPQRCDSRPLQILGIQVPCLDWQILSASTEYAARGLAVSADMFASDARIRQEVFTALDRRTNSTAACCSADCSAAYSFATSSSVVITAPSSPSIAQRVRPKTPINPQLRRLDYLFLDAPFFRMHPGSPAGPWQPGGTTDSKHVVVGLAPDAAESVSSLKRPSRES